MDASISATAFTSRVREGPGPEADLDKRRFLLVFCSTTPSSSSSLPSPSSVLPFCDALSLSETFRFDLSSHLAALAGTDFEGLATLAFGCFGTGKQASLSYDIRAQYNRMK